MLVSGAKQKRVKQANKAGVLLLSQSLAKEAAVPSHQETGGRFVFFFSCCQDNIQSLWIHMLAPLPPTTHLLLGQSKSVSNTPSKTKEKKKQSQKSNQKQTKN